MKATLTEDGYITITPETVAEKIALKYILPRMDGDSCGACGRQDQPIVFDLEIKTDEDLLEMYQKPAG